MNPGFNGFPIQTSDIISVVEFDYTGNYIVPKNTKALSIYLVGAGGGAGGGRNSALGTNAFGAGGGGGGVVIQGYYPLVQLGLQENDGLFVVIGRGGSGGTGSSTTNTNGTNGSPGGASRIFKISTSFNYPSSNSQGILFQVGGGAQSGGATNGGGFGAGNNSNLINGILIAPNFAPGGISVTTASTNIPSFLNFALNGLGGGGVNTLGVACHSFKVRTLSNAFGILQSNPLLNHGFVDFGFVPEHTNGLNARQIVTGYPETTMWGGKYGYGWFGGGGGGGSTANAGNGGDGWRGSGGGGGGGCLAGFKAGDGGKGGNGYCLIIAHA
jgi:hypothetical protein